MNSNKFFFNKSLGQNFLIDKNIISKISKFILELKPARVIEIGPGRGDISRLISHNIPLILIEKDKRLIKNLKDILPQSRIITADIRDIDLKDFEISSKDIIFSNLPYSSSTSILQYLLLKQPLCGFYILMFQREVARRIRAKTNEKDYGYISIISRLFCNIKKLLSLSPGVFFPAPKVHSELLLLSPHNNNLLDINLIDDFTIFIKKAFSQKRKKLKSSLGGLYTLMDKNFEKYLEKRPQEISIEEYILLFNKIESKQSKLNKPVQ